METVAGAEFSREAVLLREVTRGILWEQHPCDCTYGAWPERVIQNADFQQLPPLTRLSSSYFIQNASQNSSQCIKLEKKKNQIIEMQRLHYVSLHYYILPAYTIPLIPLRF